MPKSHPATQTGQISLLLAIVSDSIGMSSTSTSNAINGLGASTTIKKRSAANAEAGPSNLKRPRTDLTLDDLYDSGNDKVSKNHAELGDSQGYLVVDIAEKAHDVADAEWFRRVEVKARLEVFKLKLEGKAQSGPAVIQYVLSYISQLSFSLIAYKIASQSGTSMKIPWYGWPSSLCSNAPLYLPVN